MTTLPELFQKTQQVSSLVYRVKDNLISNSLVDFFINEKLAHENPEDSLINELLNKFKGLRTYASVLYGLKEHVDYQLAVRFPEQGLKADFLPSKQDLENKPANWLEPGDILIGLSEVTQDSAGPRVIVDAALTHYSWRYLTQPSMSPKTPRIDKFFQRIDWVKLELESDELQEQLDEISTILDQELAGLKEASDIRDVLL